MPDRITGMRMLARAANAGSLCAAARHLGLPPAMATKHVDALEARLGVKVEPGLTDSQVDLVDGSWDMAVRIGRLTGSPLQARRLADWPMLVCASPGHLAQHGVPRRVWRPVSTQLPNRRQIPSGPGCRAAEKKMNRASHRQSE